MADFSSRSFKFQLMNIQCPRDQNHSTHGTGIVKVVAGESSTDFTIQRSWLLILIVFIAYLPVTVAGYIWADPAYVTENVDLRPFP